MSDVDVMGCVNVIVAVIEMAKADAAAPKLCSPKQRDQVRQDAADFLETVVTPAAAECLLDVVIPYRRRPGGGLRWEFNETDASRRQWRNRQEKRGVL